MGLPYLQAYPLSLQQQVETLLKKPQGVERWLLKRYPRAHSMRSDKALYAYTDGLKAQYLRKASRLNSVVYDKKIHVVRNALGTHTRKAVVQGGRLNVQHQIHIAAMFKFVPEPFLKMIVTHELAHLREPEHDKAFYALCCHMEPAYHQLEFEVRVYLSHLDAGGDRLWSD